jgi:hypothetical protein
MRAATALTCERAHFKATIDPSSFHVERKVVPTYPTAGPGFETVASAEALP